MKQIYRRPNNEWVSICYSPFFAFIPLEKKDFAAVCFSG